LLGEIKLITPPIIAVGIVVANILNSLPESARVALDFAALAILFAGFLVLGRLKAQVAAAEGAASAWKEERDALSLKAERMQSEHTSCLGQVSELRVRIAELEARPTLESLEAEVKKLASLVQSTMSAMSHVPTKEDSGG
jgi:hypothetical protein